MNLLILYDGECPICRRKKTFIEKRDAKGRVSFEDIRGLDFDASVHGRDFERLEKRIHAVLEGGTVVEGMDAIRAAWRAIGRGWLIAPTGWPLFRPLFDRLYGLVARNRQKISRYFR